jgi:hypothetical protein
MQESAFLFHWPKETEGHVKGIMEKVEGIVNGGKEEFVRVSPVKHKRMELCSSRQMTGRNSVEGLYGRQTRNVFH